MHRFKELELETSLCEGPNRFLVLPASGWGRKTEIKIPQLMSHGLKDTLRERWATSPRERALLMDI